MHLNDGPPRLWSLRNVIYGVNDGLTATLGVLAGVGGATGQFHVVLVGGLAAMTASAVSMAGGAYLATKSQQEVEEHRKNNVGQEPRQAGGEDPITEAAVAGTSTLVGGAIPVLGYLIGRLLVQGSGVGALLVAFVLCLAFLFSVGSARSIFTGKGLLRSGLEMTAVGTVVAVTTYTIGRLSQSI